MGFFDSFDQAELDAMNQVYQEAEVIESGYVILPEGNYQAYIDRFFLQESKHTAGEVVLIIALKVVGGRYEGATISKYHSIRLDRMDRIKTDLITIGFPFDGIESLEDPERARQVLDVLLDITVKRKAKKTGEGNYTNVYINRNLGVYEHQDELKGENNGYAPPYGDVPPPWSR